MTDQTTLAALPCPVCGEDTVIRLPDDWQAQVNAGAAIPIVGCGNPWHYADHSLGDAPALAATPAPLDEEWYIEHRVHPAQQDWVSMRVADEEEGRDWFARWEANHNVIAARLVRKTVAIAVAYAAFDGEPS